MSEPSAPIVVEFPSELEISLFPEFLQSPATIFEVFSKEEHVRKTFAPFDEQLTVCEINLQIGGKYH